MRENLVKTLKTNFWFDGVTAHGGKIEIEEKSCQNTENKQCFGLTGKIEIEGKSRQNAKNKQTFDLNGKIEIEKKYRQNTENKQI